MGLKSTKNGQLADSAQLLDCPFCGSPAEHESTVTQEAVRCKLCPAVMAHSGSGAAVRAMWNTRVERRRG